MTNEDLWKFYTSECSRSNVDRRHPFRLANLCTFGEEYPESRIVIKRKTLKNQSHLIYTDKRTPKVEQVRKNSNCTLLLYHPKKQLQARLYGTIHLINHGKQYEEHKEIALRNEKDYTTLFTPGSPFETEIQYSEQENFILMTFHPQKIELLLLAKDGHTRAIYSANGSNSTKLIP